MSIQATQSSKHRFGPFEVDLRSGEIFKEGRPVKLQDQPFRLLTLLLQRPNELVTREELQKELWPDGTFVEFEHGLNTAIKKLRQALGDEVEQPHFIQTVPRHGYRFVGEVVRVLDPSEAAPPGLQEPRKPGWPMRMVLLGISAVAAVSMAVWLTTSWNRAPASSERFLSDLTRLTADPGLSWEPSISPDGRLVAYASDRGEQSSLDIWVKQVSGGDPLRLTDDPSDDHQPDFCSDGRVVFRSERNGGGIYSVSALGGSSTLLVPRGRGPRCSPDGSLVAYWEGSEGSYARGDVFIVQSNGGTPTRVATDLAQARLPLWSPDGRGLLLFGHAKATSMWRESDWWLVPVSGGPSKRLGVPELLARQLNFRAGAPEPCEWSARGEVVWAAQIGQVEYATAQTSLWVLSVSFSDRSVTDRVRQITAASGMHKQASMAADGTTVFASLELNPDLWTIRVNHKHLRTEGRLERITSDKSWESRPAVSTDGRLMLFRTDRGGGWDFWQKNLQTGVVRPVTISKEAKVVAAISRDGSKVAYATESGVYVVETESGSTRLIYPGRERQIADWLPTGEGLLVRNLKTGTVEVMTLQDGTCFEVVRSPRNLAGSASLSPDGRWIAFRSGGIHVAPFRGGKLIPQKDWIPVAPDGIDPRWSPDGAALYFLSSRDGPLCLWAVHLDAGTKRPLRDPIPVLHFHQRRYALQGSYSVSKDRLFLGIHETTGNIWGGRSAEMQ